MTITKTYVWGSILAIAMFWSSLVLGQGQLGQDINGAAAGDESGTAVAVEGIIMAVGTPKNDDNGTDPGQVKIYEWSGTNWVQKGLSLDGENAGDEFGNSVAVNGNRVAIGAPKNDDSAIEGDWSGTFSFFGW